MRAIQAPETSAVFPPTAEVILFLESTKGEVGAPQASHDCQAGDLSPAIQQPIGPRGFNRWGMPDADAPFLRGLAGEEWGARQNS
jgi:hypothetical protein